MEPSRQMQIESLASDSRRLQRRPSLNAKKWATSQRLTSSRNSRFFERSGNEF
jgi:hypothetical protein